MSLRRLTVRGKENLPKDGAVIIGCNHTNALLDPLVILRAMNRATVFMTRSDVFRKPMLKKLFTYFKMLPIFRIRDGYTAVKQNEEIIGKCVEVLRHDYPLALFPEATHRPKHSLLSLSKGIFHIALETNKNIGHERPVYIVPMGLEYGNYYRYRSNVVATYGEPINVTEFVRQYEGEVTPARMLAMLREELSLRMSKLIAYLPDTEDYDAQWELTKLCTAQMRPLSTAERLTLNQTVIRHLEEKKEQQDTETVASVYTEALEFKKERRSCGVRTSSTGHKYPLAASIANSIVLLCTFPYYLFCMLMALPSWVLSHIIVGKIKDKAFANTARLGVNLILWPLLILIWAIVLLCSMSLVPALICIALIIPAVAFFYDYNAFAMHTLSDWKWTFNTHLHSRLAKLLKWCK